jgi:hypothetical protein
MRGIDCTPEQLAAAERFILRCAKRDRPEPTAICRLKA